MTICTKKKLKNMVKAREDDTFVNYSLLTVYDKNRTVYDKNGTIFLLCYAFSVSAAVLQDAVKQTADGSDQTIGTTKIGRLHYVSY